MNYLQDKSQRFLFERMGDISQIAGIKRYTLLEGRAKGVEAADFKTGAGLEFTVLPGRGMDIAWAHCKGASIGYLSKTGVVSPAFYESNGMNGLRNFYAGLLTTCGLLNVGGPCEEEHPIVGTQQYGLHGRIANTIADHIHASEQWEDGVYVMRLSGRVKEAQLHAENITLTREVKAFMGQNKLVIHDIVENESWQDQPVMLLYHINLGYPLLDDGARILLDTESITPNDEFSRTKLSDWNRMGSPVKGIAENVYFHEVKANGDGECSIALENDALMMGVSIRYKKSELPYLTQWKMMGQQEYVLGIEPGNCTPRGRSWHKENGTLEILKSGEKKEVTLEISVTEGA